MRKTALSFTTVLGAMLALSLPVTPAQAASAKTWVDSTGTNNATCGRTTPCDTFQHAHDATTAKGEINCVDAGDYGPLLITKAISIVCDNTQAGILVSHLNTGVIIRAGATDIVTLKGLDIEGEGLGNAGILFQTGAALHVHKVHIRNFREGGSGAGIFSNRAPTPNST